MDIKLFTLATSLFLSTNANATIISVDWINEGDNLITRDTATGLEWLDLSVTSNNSYYGVSLDMAENQALDGWRFATTNEVSGFFDSFGGNSDFYNGESTQNNGLFDNIAPYWGDLLADGSTELTPGNGYSYFMTQTPDASTYVSFGLIYDLGSQRDVTESVFLTTTLQRWKDSASSTAGAALVRDTPSPVPLPAAFWLFGSALLAMAGLFRKQRA